MVERAPVSGEPRRPAIRRVDVLGVGISAVCLDSAVAEISRWFEDGESHYVCVTGVHGVMESQDDPRVLAIHNRSGLTVPDGMPMVWAGRYAGFSRMTRVAGPDLVPAICAHGLAGGWRHYFYGGAEGVPERLAEALVARFPGMQVAGAFSPPFRPLDDHEKTRIAERINAARPHIVWIGLSTPKQERWMDEMLARLDAAALLGVGAAFDVLSGRTARAPRWIRPSGFEWLYRTLKEPRRLAGRYLKNNPRFVWRVLRRPPCPMA